MATSAYARDFAIRKWLMGLDDALWGQLPVFYRRLLVQRYGLEGRGAELGLVIERPMGIRELGALLGFAHQNAAVLVNRALQFLMRKILIERLEAGDGTFPAELLDVVFPRELQDRPAERWSSG